MEIKRYDWNDNRQCLDVIEDGDYVTYEAHMAKVVELVFASRKEEIRLQGLHKSECEYSANLQAKLDKALIGLKAISSAYPVVGDHLTYPELATETIAEISKG